MEKQEIVEKISDLISRLLMEFGTDSYNIRCELYDIKEAIKNLKTTH